MGRAANARTPLPNPNSPKTGKTDKPIDPHMVDSLVGLGAPPPLESKQWPGISSPPDRKPGTLNKTDKRRIRRSILVLQRSRLSWKH